MQERPSGIIIEINSYSSKEQIRTNKIIDTVQQKFGFIPFEYKTNEFINTLLEEDNQATCTNTLAKNSLLIIRKNPGEFIKKCPGTPNYVCCNYWVINLYINCPLSCQYCFLQFYLPHNHMIIHLNLEDLFHEFQEKYQKYGITRIGTGELSDSLYFDDITFFSRELIDFFSLYPDCYFEFKTKTTIIENLPKLTKNHNIVAGFSLNPPEIIKTTEPKSASLHERIKAASELIQKGYKVSFHFDPIIVTNSFIQLYSEFFLYILKLFDNDSIAWISLGALRYHPSMREKIRQNFPKENITKSESIIGLDGKVRYFTDIRFKIYKSLYSIYKSLNKSFPLYLCMESKKIWDSLETADLLSIDNLKKIFSVTKKD